MVVGSRHTPQHLELAEEETKRRRRRRKSCTFVKI